MPHIFDLAPVWSGVLCLCVYGSLFFILTHTHTHFIFHFAFTVCRCTHTRQPLTIVAPTHLLLLGEGVHLVLQAQHFPLYPAAMGPNAGLHSCLRHCDPEDVQVSSPSTALLLHMANSSMFHSNT